LIRAIFESFGYGVILVLVVLGLSGVGWLGVHYIPGVMKILAIIALITFFGAMIRDAMEK
jgi:hypothetical protein